MDTASAPNPALQRAVFEDGLGKRHHAAAPGGEPLELLELRHEFSTSAFEVALRERVTALAGFETTCFSRVRGVQRINQNVSKVFVFSDRVPGARLATVLAVAKPQRVPLEMNATLCLIRQLVAAIALLHEKLPGIAHGAIAPERIVITPEARLVVADHVLGSALEQMRYSADRYWKELRVPLPPADQPAFDQRADVMQIGTIALELILGRPIFAEEYPNRIHELTERAWTSTATGGVKNLPPELRPWLLRTLQFDPKEAFASAVDAWADLEHVLHASNNVASFGALESVMAEYARTTAAATVVTTPSVPVRPRIVSTTPSKPTVVTSAGTPPAATPMTPPAPPAISSRPAAAPVVLRAFEAAPPSTEPRATPDAPAAADANAQRTTPRRRLRWVAAAAVLVLLASGGALFGRRYVVPPAAAEELGTLVVTTNPAGVPVVVDGQPRGVTPLTVELAAGWHELKLVTEGEPRIIPVTISAGSTVAQTVELPKAAPLTGQLTIRSEPPGARVTIDGIPIGPTPLNVEALTPGTHSVVLETDLSSVTQEVTIEAGTTASLIVPMTPQGVPVSGWISVTAPVEVHVYEDGRLIGTSRNDRITVTAGRHELEVVNEALNYRAARSVTVSAGKVSTLRLEWPKGSMSLNAQPWADVWIGGERIGETPIGNLSMPIGTHEVLFRHPQLGEQVVRATVTASTPTRVTVDMRKR
jgi:hypothetical protein